MGTDANKPTRIDSDRNWTQFGQTDPYYAVVTDEKYRRGQLSDDHLAEFFETGRRHVEWTFGMIHRHFQPDFRPRRALDFGCGVGRLAIPLAARCEQVVGADIAPGMLEEARKNCAQRNITNVEFILSERMLRLLTGTFDLIHSYIVFQHIPVYAGRALARTMVSHLKEGGIGALEFLAHRHGSRLRLAGSWMEKHVPLFHNFVNLARGRKWSEPLMQMNVYNLNQILMDLYDANCDNVHVHLVTHVGCVGAMVFFQKNSGMDKTPLNA